jgi:hypothetical protein
MKVYFYSDRVYTFYEPMQLRMTNYPVRLLPAGLFVDTD